MFVVILSLQQLIFQLGDKTDEMLVEGLISFVLGSVITGTTNNNV